jgi:superfamily II DNA helicase RecQ
MRLDFLRTTYPDVPLIACTATATEKVIGDIQTTLLLKDSPCFIGSFDRPNIFYKVKYKDSLDATGVNGAAGDLVRFVRKQYEQCTEQGMEFSGIVYVHTRADTAELASSLRKGTGLGVAAYHGGMKADERKKMQESWTAGEVKVAVATIAFGEEYVSADCFVKTYFIVRYCR